MSHVFGSLLSWHWDENHKKLPVWHTWHIVSLSLHLVSEVVKSEDSPQSGNNFRSAKVRSNSYTNSTKIAITLEPIMQFWCSLKFRIWKICMAFFLWHKAPSLKLAVDLKFFFSSKWDYWENRSFLSAQDFVKVFKNGKPLHRNNKKINRAFFC